MNNSGYSYAKNEFKLFKLKEQGGLELVEEGHRIYTNYGNKSVPISDSTFIDLPPGKYIIRAKIFRPIDEPYYNKYILSFYSSS